MLKKIYVAIGAFLIGSYATVALMGMEFGDPVLKKQSPSARHSSGGSRGIWFFGGGYGGYGGGK